MKQVIHKHHIVPRYKCKELGIDPDFDDNIVEVTRLQHANIHWGYWCKDLSALLEVCSPPQYVIDMIPLGDKRDIPAAQILAEGEIDGIDMSGENHPMYKHGLCLGWDTADPEIKREYNSNYKKMYRQSPEGIAKERAYESRPERIVSQKKRKIEKRDETRVYDREYYAKNKDRILVQQKEYRQRKKLKKHGVGTLEPYMG